MLAEKKHFVVFRILFFTLKFQVQEEILAIKGYLTDGYCDLLDNDFAVLNQINNLAMYIWRPVENKHYFKPIIAITMIFN